LSRRGGERIREGIGGESEEEKGIEIAEEEKCKKE